MLANSPRWEGDLAIDHGVMRDLLDVDAVQATLARLGITFPFRPSPDQRERIVSVFAKSEADPRGTIRGQRHVMLDDDDVSDTRWSRCALSAVLASLVGDGAVYVSTRAEHMGPARGRPGRDHRARLIGAVRRVNRRGANRQERQERQKSSFVEREKTRSVIVETNNHFFLALWRPWRFAPLQYSRRRVH